ncbi:MAG: DUF4836 family protein [Bacteroidaceae bacterium]|nr:DUF4836 family protein [Bacteroidaceae bacterium]
MKTIYHLLFVFGLLMAVCSCSKTDYQNTIPANATLVAKVDVRTVAEKWDLAHSEVMKNLDSYLKLLVSGKDMEQAKEYIDDPMKMGFDFTMPVFFFKMPDGSMGLTMKVNDDGDVKDFLMLLQKQGLASKPVERRDLMCGTLMGDFHYAYDGKTFLLLSSEGSSSRVGQMAQQLMNQKEDESFVSTDAYSKLEHETTEVVCYAKLLALPLPAYTYVRHLLMLPNSVRESDIEMLATMNLDNGKETFHCTAWGNTEKVQQLLDEANKNLHKIQGRYIDKASEDLPIWLGLGVKGEWLLQKLKGDKKAKEMLFLLGRAIDIEQMLKAVDGDVAVGLSQHVFDGNTDDFVAYAQLKNTNFLQDVDYWKSSMKEYGMSMQDDGNHHYVLHAEGKVWQWGVDGNDLYYAADGALSRLENTPDTKLKTYEAEMKDNWLFLYLDMAKMGWEKKLKGRAAMLGKALGDIESIIVKSSAANEVDVVIEMKKKQENK